MNGQKIRVCANFGFALFPDHGKGEKELITHADAAISLAREASNKSQPG